MSRRVAAVAVVALAVLGWFMGPLWQERGDVAPGTGKVRANDVLIEVFNEELCRLPLDEDTLKWGALPPKKAELLPAIKATEEAQRALQIRRQYLAIVGRDPFDGDCAAVRRWVESPLSLEAIHQRLAGSAEARRVSEVRQTFVEMLGRDPIGWDNASLRHWVDSELTASAIRAQLAAQRPLVGVHYFTWYRRDSKGWGNDATRVHAAAPRPALGWYQSTDLAVIDTQLDQMSTAGFDFVIVNVVARSPASWAAAHQVFDRLKGRALKAAVMLDGLYDETEGRAQWVEKAQTEFTPHENYFSYQGKPLILLFSTLLNLKRAGAVLRNVYFSPAYDPGGNLFNLDHLLYPYDWPFWAASPQPVINGVVPVIPGYADKHLGRPNAMEHLRRDGQLYHDQWQRALSLHPELIIVYSWNEHFEQTAIEPVDAWGDRYLRWTACYANHAHSGTSGRCS